MHPLALPPEDDQQLKGLAADVRDGVRNPGVELGGLTDAQKEILSPLFMAIVLITALQVRASRRLVPHEGSDEDAALR
jgi:hypothetical protein